jgi:hypothetical protein
MIITKEIQLRGCALSRVSLKTGPGVFEVLASVCHSHQEALKQFIENAADAIQQLGTDEGRISIQLQYEELKGESPSRALKNIIVSDNGIGMRPRKMKHVLEHIGDSEKVQFALQGEKGIGLLAFSLIAEELHLASSPKDGVASNCLVFKRSWLKKGKGEIVESCPRHTHSERGTHAFLENILPEAADKLSKERLKEYLGREFASDLRRALYAMTISDDTVQEPVPPQRYRGVKAMTSPIPLGKAGSASIELHVLPWEMADATISLYGRGGARICFLTDLDEFKFAPWIDRRIEGHVRFDDLKRTADKAAVVQDEVYQKLVTELHKLEPLIKKTIEDISAESRERRYDLIMHKTSRLIDRFLRYRDRGLLDELIASSRAGKADERKSVAREPGAPPSSEKPPKSRPNHPRPIDARVPGIAFQAPPREKSLARSWFDAGSGSICINREHPEFMLSQREDTRCVRYLFSIWVKESLLQEYGADAERLADEMVGMLAEAEPLLW